MDCSMPGFPVYRQLLEFTHTHVYWINDAIQPSHPLSPLSPPAFNISSNRVFSNESALLIRWPQFWSISFSISPSNEYSGFISFRVDWFDLLAVQGTLKCLLQQHSSEASVLGTQPSLRSSSHIRTWLLETFLTKIITAKSFLPYKVTVTGLGD